MKRHLLKVTFCTLVLTAAGIVRADQAAEVPPAAPPVEEKDWSVAVSGDWYSEYVFRGVDLTGNRSLWSPTVAASWKDFTVSYWGAYSDVKGAGWYEEADFTASYSHSFFDDKLTLGGGYIFYWYPDGISAAEDTHELFGSATVNVLLSPTVALYYDIDELHGGYLTFGVSHSFDIGKALGTDEGTLSVIPSAQLGIDLGYNSRSSNSDVQPNDILLGVKVPWKVTDNLELHAGFQLSIALDSLNDIGQGNERIFNLGATFSY